MIGSSDNSGGVVLCVEQNVAGPNLAFDFFSLVEIFLSSCRISVHNEILLYHQHVSSAAERAGSGFKTNILLVTKLLT